MLILARCGTRLIWALAILAASFCSGTQALAQPQTVSIIIVRHAESDNSQPTVPLSAAGRQRAALLAPTLAGVSFTHLFASQPCLDNKCFPAAFDRIWHLVLEPGRAVPLAFVELRYGAGWQASER